MTDSVRLVRPYQSFPPTCEQVQRMLQLIATLEKVKELWPEHFDMTHYHRPRYALSKKTPFNVTEVQVDGGVVRYLLKDFVAFAEGEHPAECNTVCCMIGWAPYATGIPVGLDMNWVRYAREVLGVGPEWYNHLFLSTTRPTDVDYHLESLRKWVDRYVHVCQD